MRQRSIRWSEATPCANCLDGKVHKALFDENMSFTLLGKQCPPCFNNLFKTKHPSETEPSMHKKVGLPMATSKGVKTRVKVWGHLIHLNAMFSSRKMRSRFRGALV
mmetsp:Transcript_1901/g.11596  ORF Transcript_1901/g.11596 Transcript_1901/m.11596 type:complete len:106 (+) Transcript_1901:653-970(+)